MAWLAVDKDGTEVISQVEIKRNTEIHKMKDRIWTIREERDFENGVREWLVYVSKDEYRRNGSSFGYFNKNSIIKLPKGTIEKIIGKVLTWDDEPVEI